MSNPKPIVLVTGGAGRIGTAFAKGSHDRYDLRLMVRGDEPRLPEVEGLGEVTVCELADVDTLERLCDGTDAVLHLAANPSGAAKWESLLPDNIEGTHNICIAAAEAKCRRLVMASTIQTIYGYKRHVQVRTTDIPRPHNLYGVSKVFLEAMGRCMWEQHGLSTVAIRFGAFLHEHEITGSQPPGMANEIVTVRDGVQLMQKTIDTPNIGFAVAHGLSHGFPNRLDISDTCERFGYEPQDTIATTPPPASV